MAEYQLIGDMTYEYNADVGLAYASPVRGVWNIVHIATLVPEGHQIFVCPTSCLRGVVLTTAEMGAMDKLSTITVGEDNILEGDMEEALQRGTERIIEELPVRPRMMMIFTSCIHHFMAVNYQRVYKILRKEYPDIDFIDCYMDPIMRRTAPVVPALWRQIHRALRKPEQATSFTKTENSSTTARCPAPGSSTATASLTASGSSAATASLTASGSFTGEQANYIGNCFPHLPETCDLSALLMENGVKYLEVNSCQDYEEFLSMRSSKANFVFHATGIKAAKDMKMRLGQEWVRMRPGYSYDEFDQDLAKAALLLGINKTEQQAHSKTQNPDKATAIQTQMTDNNTSAQIKKAVFLTEEWSREQRFLTESAVSDAKNVIGDTPISVDYTSVDCPLEFALYLLRHGFNVESVFVDVFTETEEIFDQLKVLKPDLKIYASLGVSIRQMDRKHDGKILCVGQKCAYFMNSDYFVNLVENAGLYGYRGIREMMRLMTEAYQEAKPMKELVQVKGWGCHCS